MAIKSSVNPGETGQLYRYRTTVLVGPWRKSARQAVLDALHAKQARRHEHDRELVQWIVPGRIETKEAT